MSKTELFSKIDNILTWPIHKLKIIDPRTTKNLSG